ncbi:hypothetical protein FRC14_004430 [Serendipita sp. 396]|nr:hypothetical protein FRC14_004430 [Serendipita sp. 396]
MHPTSPAAKRRFHLPETRQKPRNELESTKIPAIDAFLKALRPYSRRVSNLVHSHANEVQVLQKIVYKSKNQHKNAVFWRGVVELRRFACRIEEASLFQLIDASRNAFYSHVLVSAVTRKTTPWDALPSTYFLQYILKRISSLCGLYIKASEAYHRVFESFGRFSHSISFLQLALVLMGITARIWLLTTEIHEISIQFWKDLHHLISQIDESHTRCVCAAPKLSSSCLQPSFAVVELASGTAVEGGEESSKELGKTLNRLESQKLLIQEESRMTVAPHEQTIQGNFEDAIMLDVDTQDIPIVSTDVVLDIESSQLPIGIIVSQDGHSREKKKRRKKTLNEIDAIFD